MKKQPSYYSYEELQKPIAFDSERLLLKPNLQCANNEMTLVVCIPSAVLNAKNRDAIRQSWGSLAAKAGPVGLVFVVGRANDSIQVQLTEEHALHSDLVQGDFLDTYRNLTLKSMTMLRWATTECPSAEFLLKADDDTFINIPLLAMYLRYYRTKKELLMGHLYTKSPVDRNISSKWYISKNEFSGNKYPPYLSGGSYLMSSNVARRIFGVCSRSKFFPMEDAFVTGICASKANVLPTNNDKFSYQKLLPSNGCRFKFMISGHDVSNGEMSNIWADIKDLKTLKCNKTYEKPKETYRHVAKLSD